MLNWSHFAALAEGPPNTRVNPSAHPVAYAEIGQGLVRGYTLCVKHTNEKGGMLGRPLELLVYDDASDSATAARLYDRLIAQDKVDLVLAPFSPPIVDAVADVTEKHKLPMVTTSGATSVYRKGRKFIFSLIPPSEHFLEGLIDLAAKKGLKTVALINADDLGGRAMRQGGIELAKKKGLQVLRLRGLDVTHVALRLFWPGMTQAEALGMIDLVAARLLPTLQRL